MEVVRGGRMPTSWLFYHGVRKRPHAEKTAPVIIATGRSRLGRLSWARLLQSMENRLIFLPAGRWRGCIEPRWFGWLSCEGGRLILCYMSLCFL